MSKGTPWSITGVSSAAGAAVSSGVVTAPTGKAARLYGVNWAQGTSGTSAQYFRVLNLAGSTVMHDAAGDRLSGYVGDGDCGLVQSDKLVFEFSASGTGLQTFFAWGEYVG